MRGTGRGRCKVVMWRNRTRPVGCTTGCTTAVRIYGRFSASSSCCCTAVQLYACSVGRVSAVYGCTHASTAGPQLCMAVRGQKQFPFASWSLIASAMPRAVHIHDVGGNPRCWRSRIFRAPRTHGCRLAKATPASTHKRNEVVI